MLKIRRSRDRLIFNMGIPILVRRHPYIKTGPDTFSPLSNHCSSSENRVSHRNENVVILTKFTTLVALEVVILTTSSAASDENFIKIKTFPFQYIANEIYGKPILQELEWLDLKIGHRKSSPKEATRAKYPSDCLSLPFLWHALYKTQSWFWVCA